MANYSSNDKKPTTTTYSPISFSNPTSELSKTKLSINYFNKLLKICIAARKENTSNNTGYDNYDNENQATAYVSVAKAKILLDLIKNQLPNDDVHNVGVEVTNGLVCVSDGSEFGVDSPCIVLYSADQNGNVSTAIYHTKDKFHKGIYNYDSTTMEHTDVINSTIEIDMFIIVLEEYVKASTYAIAASVMESSMYKREYISQVIHNIGVKVGAISESNNSKSFFSAAVSNAVQTNNNGEMKGAAPKEYEVSSFDDIANAMR